MKMTTVDGIKIREYLRERRESLKYDKEIYTTGSARRAISSAISELMFVEEHLDEIDPIGKIKFQEILKKQEEL